MFKFYKSNEEITETVIENCFKMLKERKLIKDYKINNIISAIKNILLPTKEILRIVFSSRKLAFIISLLSSLFYHKIEDYKRHYPWELLSTRTLADKKS